MAGQVNNMGKKLSDMFNITYTNSVTSSHVVFSTQSDTAFYTHHLEMITFNQKALKTIIPPDYRKRDNLLDFFYEITSKITLTDYLLKNVLTKKDVMHILLAIAETLDQCGSYLLSADKFILDTDYIYLDTNSESICLVYIPLKETFDAITQFKNFLINFISVKAKISTDQNDNYTQRILEFMKDDHITIHSIKEMLNQLDRKPAVSGQQNRTFQNEERDEGLTLDYIPNNKSIEKNKKKIFKKPPVTPGREDIRIPKGWIDHHENKPPEKEHKDNTVQGHMIWFILGLIVISLILGIVLIAVKGGDQKGFQILGLIVVFTGVSYIACKKFDVLDMVKKNNGKPNQRKLVKQVKDKPKSNIETHDKTVSRQRQINIPIPVFQFSKNENEDNKIEAPNTQDKVASLDAQRTTPSSVVTERGGQMNTVVLSNNKRRLLYLVKTSTDSKIFVNTTPFVLGRLKEFADYAINNPAIGKSHCEISYDDNDVYVKDLDSKNGTYINDIKLKSQKLVPVQDGDRLTLANEGYVIKCQ